MTANQIKYNEYLEGARHNRVSEAHEHRSVGAEESKARAALLQASTAQASQEEAARHNKQTEAYNWWSGFNNLIETQRHNKEGERISQYQADTSRYLGEGSLEVSKGQLEVAKRQATVSEREADTHWYSAQTGRQQLSLGYAQLAETARHNQAYEAETRRHNTQVESEATRSNKAMELNRFGTLQTQRAYNRESLEVQNRQADASWRQADARYASAEAAKTSALANAANAETNARRQYQDMWFGIWNAGTGVVHDVSKMIGGSR